jgi:Fibronectin type III domain
LHGPSSWIGKHRMKHPFSVRNTCGIIIGLLLTLIPLTAFADCVVTLQWNPNNPSLEGYQVFGREAGQDYDYDAAWWQGDQTFTQCTIDHLDENKTYFFTVRAFQGDNLSADSNEVEFSYKDSSTSSNSASVGSNDGSGTASLTGLGDAGCFIQSLFR